MVNSIKVSDNIPAPEAPVSPEMTKLGGNIVAGNLVDVSGKKKGPAGEKKEINVSVQHGGILKYIIIAAIALIIIFVIVRKRKKNQTRKR
jgi:hypothetical protein